LIQFTRASQITRCDVVFIGVLVFVVL